MAESKVRLERHGGFTVLQNGLIRDKRLSLKTKGLMAVLVSLPPNWEHSIAGLASICNVGRDSIRSALKELEAAGYLERSQSHDESGHFGGCVYVIHEESREPTNDMEDDGTPLSGFPSTANPSSGEPSSGEPSSGEPSSGNPTELNKEVLNKDIYNPPIVPPQGDGLQEKSKPRRRRKRHSPRDAPDWKPERFEGLWRYYPDRGRKDKQAAMDEWDKLQPDDALIDKMALALKKLKERDEQWREGFGVPYLSRWLKNRRWEDADEIPDKPPDDDSDGGWADDPEVI